VKWNPGGDDYVDLISIPFYLFANLEYKVLNSAFIADIHESNFNNISRFSIESRVDLIYFDTKGFSLSYNHYYTITVILNKDTVYTTHMSSS